MSEQDENAALFFQLPVPVSFSCIEPDVAAFEYATRPVSIFHNGFVISSPRGLKIGSKVMLRMRVPPEKSGGHFREGLAVGRVVAEQRLKDGSIGYRIETE
jgi:hypothetical protein